VRRALASWCLCALALVVGVLTAALAADNRERGDDLDQLERWCEAQSRQNELVRVQNAEREWCLLGQTCPDEAAAGPHAHATAVPDAKASAKKKGQASP